MIRLYWQLDLLIFGSSLYSRKERGAWFINDDISGDNCRVIDNKEKKIIKWMEYWIIYQIMLNIINRLIIFLYGIYYVTS